MGAAEKSGPGSNVAGCLGGSKTNLSETFLFSLFSKVETISGKNLFFNINKEAEFGQPISKTLSRPGFFILVPLKKAAKFALETSSSISPKIDVHKESTFIFLAEKMWIKNSLILQKLSTIVKRSFFEIKKNSCIIKTMTEEKTNNQTPGDVLYKWTAPARPFKKRDRVFFQTAIAFVFLLAAILFFIKEWLLIGVILAVFFVGYALSAVEPPQVRIQITKKGVWVGEEFYKFSEMAEYWFEKNLESEVLVLTLPLKTPGRLDLVLSGVSKVEVDAVFREKLVFREKPIKSFVDNLSEWLKKKFPFEEQKKTQTS